MVRYDDVYKLLSSLDELDDVQYNKLVDLYSIRLINSILKKLVSEDSRYEKIFSKYISDLSFDDDNDNIVTMYQYYIKDISQLVEISDSNKDVLLNELVLIIKKLNILFDKLECDDKILGGNKRALICDKVEYCIKYCDDLELLDEIKKLYSVYVDKRNIFLNGYLKFVISIASDYVIDGRIEFNDLIQYGNMGLIRAIESYDSKFNTKFSTYASDWISHSIKYNMKKDLYQIRKPNHMFELNSKRIKAINNLLHELGREPSNREVAEYLGISLDDVKYLESIFLETKSIDECIEITLDDVFIVKSDFIADDMIDVEKSVINNSLCDELNECMLEYLSDKENFVLYCRYNMDMKFHEIGNILGLTYQRATQIHNEAIKKLRKKKRVKKMESYIR